eukprot:TRINITY_DN12257_c0_g1_i1.p1 TRINITY_DN12257_c0_g1~~TRINITY_DN12257_c0_g1_i1.p1  ORF type:complete len:124 (-),score=10.37 TRINITY_DN12257_c0_g1_i1:117-488(-)
MSSIVSFTRLNNTHKCSIKHGNCCPEFGAQELIPPSELKVANLRPAPLQQSPSLTEQQTRPRTMHNNQRANMTCLELYSVSQSASSFASTSALFPVHTVCEKDPLPYDMKKMTAFFASFALKM